jgi:hypothetical protein
VDGATAHGHDRVGAGEAVAAELAPEVGEDGRRLGRLGVGHGRQVGDSAAAGNGGGDAPCRTGQGLAVHHEDLLCLLGQDIGHLVEQVPADGDVIAVADADDAHRAPPSRATISAAMSSGVRVAVSTTWVASRV